MKKILFVSLLLLVFCQVKAGQWIRVNQLGYLPDARKVAVFMSEELMSVDRFELKDAFTHATVLTFNSVKSAGKYGTMSSTYRLNFTAFEGVGSFYLAAGKATSPVFRINAHVYDGTADFLLTYMRQQRCGYNPWLKDSCHLHDGYMVYHPTRSGEHVDVTGGWHDATDYLQYTATSSNAIYQMMLAYQQNPQSFGDAFKANGMPGANGIPDIVDEIKWGLDWLNRMNPEKGMMFNQIADDRDHAGFRLPTRDSVDYGWGKGTGRPVYFCTGEQQGLLRHKNRATGIASTAGKFASCFALGSKVLADFYPDFARQIGEKAADAFEHGVQHPGACQTAPGTAPYFYEEDNWTDDMQLAAAELYRKTGDEKYMKQAVNYGRMEPVTPWMGADSARHYQWYPFINVGHYLLSNSPDKRVGDEFKRNLRTGIERVFEKAQTNPFLNGIPYIWCSNNLVSALVTQCRLYRESTDDVRYEEMEAALRDWLFGCNPWGTSMIVGLPSWGDTPEYPHSSYVTAGIGNTPGGLVDGPVYGAIFNGLLGVKITEPDVYAPFQSDLVVYHDDVSDYSTNEPTMDGTASLTYYLSAMQKDGMKQLGKHSSGNMEDAGGIIRTDPSKKQLTLVFTAADKADGADVIRQTLKRQQIQGAFFFTGGFYKEFPDVVKTLKQDGHYLGAHSNDHLLYCAWEKRDSTLVTREVFAKDMTENYRLMAEAGIRATEAPLFIPPYEWYNEEVAGWAQGMGLKIVNFTPGTGSNADYTTPDMKNYKSSKDIYNRIMKVEASEGLNGHLLLVHFGTHPDRTD
ncbi:MAG: glycoside hydrolase family 9 protein, partial [Parabacteroides sp.]|nr:glycoside hydrolase family 9 protein [Parabacteroides sp.]